MKSSKSKSSNLNSTKSKSSKTLLSDVLRSLYHPRYTSAKHSPYQDKTSIERLKTLLESSVKCQSPKNSILCTTQRKSSKKLLRTHSKKRKTSSKQKIKHLVELNTANPIKYAPKIFENQFFYDVYDSKNNHDRVLITPSDSFCTKNDENSLSNVKFVISTNLNTSETNISDSLPKPPDNSYTSSQAQVPFHLNLVEKLQNLINP